MSASLSSQTSTTNGAKRDRDGDSMNPALQSLKSRHRAAWPTEEELDKYLANINSDDASDENKNNKATANYVTAAQKDFAHFIYRFHDRPHNARLEWWYINGHVGTCKETNTAYSFFAAFFKLHVLGDHYAYAVNWALTEVPHLATETQEGAPKKITLRPPPPFSPGSAANVGKYHTFASQDPITPMVIDTLMSQGKFAMKDPRVAQQIQLMAKSGLLPAPDTLFTAAATCRGSADAEESLFVEIDGNVFSAAFPAGAAAPTYTMKLSGTTQRGEPSAAETSASLEISFAPSVATTGSGPVLQGKKGVVAVDNFENDMFYYFTPRCAVVPGTGGPKLTIDGKSIAIDCENGEDQRIWVDHEFGGAPPATPEEVKALEQREANDYNWDWGAFHIPGLASVSIAIVREENPAIPPMIWGAVQPEYKGEGGANAPFFSVYYDSALGPQDPANPIRIITDTSVPTFNSPDTAMIFPTAWTIHIPSLKGLTMRTVSAIPQQEFINLMAKPSYLEGRAHIEASWVEADGTARHVVTGMGFMEARGVVNTAQIEQIAMITHATVFMPAEMMPAPPPELWAGLPASVLPTTAATIRAMMAFAPPPKPKDNQVDFIAATVATYASVLHRGGDEAEARRLVAWWAAQKRAYLTATAAGLRAGVKDVGIAAMMQKELEGMVVRKVPSVAAAAAAGDAEAAMKFIFAVEEEAEKPSTQCVSDDSSPLATGEEGEDTATNKNDNTGDENNTTSTDSNDVDPNDPFSSLAALAAAAGITSLAAAHPAQLITKLQSAGISVPPELIQSCLKIATAATKATTAAVTAAATAAPLSLVTLAEQSAVEAAKAVQTVSDKIAAAVASSSIASSASSSASSTPATVDPIISSVIAMAAAAGITIPSELASQPAQLVAMAKAAGIPIPEAVITALGLQ